MLNHKRVEISRIEQDYAPFDVVSMLEERRMLIPGLVIQAEPKRRYPYGATTAHLVGYVNEVTETELASTRYAGARMGTLVGRDGLERQYDDRLRGEDGRRYVEVDAHGRIVREPQRTLVPRNVRLAEAPSFGKPTLLYDVTSAGAQAYLALADELGDAAFGQFVVGVSRLPGFLDVHFNARRGQ